MRLYLGHRLEQVGVESAEEPLFPQGLKSRVARHRYLPMEFFGGLFNLDLTQHVSDVFHRGPAALGISAQHAANDSREFGRALGPLPLPRLELREQIRFEHKITWSRHPWDTDTPEKLG